MKILEKFTKKQKILVCVEGIALLLLVIYTGMAFFFNHHFGFRTTINGVKASAKTPEQVERMIQKEIDGYELVLEKRGNKSEVLQGNKIGLKPEFDGSLQKELEKQNGFAWPLHIFHSSDIEVKTMVTYEKAALEREIQNLSCMDEGQMKEAESAAISEYSEQNGYTILPEKEGTVIDEEKFRSTIDSSITNLQKSISLEEQKCYVEPKYTKTSPEVKAAAEAVNKYVKAEVIYEFGEKTEELEGKTISQWITVNENMEAALSEKKAEEYIAKLAEEYNTVGKPKTLATSYGVTITIHNGDYGWKIDKEAEKEMLLENIKNGETISREPVYAKRAVSREGNDYGNTYVELNLTAQRLFYYKNGALVLETDFVSGNEAKGWHTPEGAYGLYYKQRDKTLRGEDYATPVSYWMPFNGGVGFHDATWRSDFGGNKYKTGGSHGCINMPYSAARNLYENIEAGCPIFVYKLPGTESEKGKAQDAAVIVVNAINAIGEVTPDKRELISSARAQYEAQNDMAKGYVTNYEVLLAAEAQMAGLDAWEADRQAQSQAQPVIDAIDRELAEQEITRDKKAVIKEIRKMYNALSDAAKAKVTNYSVLTKAEKM